MKTAREILSITRLCEKREIFWHGTHIKALRKILKTGLDHKEKRQRVWGEETNGLESYPGNYFTQRLSTALVNATGATQKFGGPSCLIEVQLETRTALHDEDNMQEMKVSLKYAYSKEYPGINLDKYSAEGLMNLGPDAVKRVLDSAVGEWVNDCLFNPEAPNPHPTVPKALERLYPILYRWAEVSLEQTVMYGGSFLDNYRNESPEYRELEDKVIMALRGSPARRKKDIFSRNVRVDDPVTFSGANKILSAIVFPFKFSRAYATLSDDIMDDERDGIFVLYGNPSNEFYEAYSKYNEGAYESWRGNFNDLSKLYSDFGITIPFDQLGKTR